MPTATLGTARSQARPTAIVHCPTANSVRGTHSETADRPAPSTLNSTSPRDRSRPTTRATRRWPPGAVASGSTTIASAASRGTANDVASTQPPSSTTTPVDGPLAGVASADDASAASDTPAVSIRTTAGATRSTAARIAASSSNGSSSVADADAVATVPKQVPRNAPSKRQRKRQTSRRISDSSLRPVVARVRIPRSHRCGRPTA